jgi:hypothetical protein
MVLRDFFAGGGYFTPEAWTQLTPEVREAAIIAYREHIADLMTTFVALQLGGLSKVMEVRAALLGEKEQLEDYIMTTLMDAPLTDNGK